MMKDEAAAPGESAAAMRGDGDPRQRLIESDGAGAFGEKDRLFVERCAAELSRGGFSD